MEETTPVMLALHVAPDPPPPLSVQEGGLVYPLPRLVTSAEVKVAGGLWKALHRYPRAHSNSLPSKARHYRLPCPILRE